MREVDRFLFLALAVLGMALFVGCSMFGPNSEDAAHADRLRPGLTDYREWDSVPGLDEWVPGTSVHGQILRYYANDVALGNMADLSPGSILVTEGYNRERVLLAVTVMHRVAGYDPEHGDWFWARYTPQGELTHAGSVSTCIACHRNADGNDYAFANAGF